MTRGSIAAARGDINEGIQELEAAVHGAAEHNDREAVWQTRYRLAMAYWKNGDLSGARTLLSRSLEVIERVAAELLPACEVCIGVLRFAKLSEITSTT